MSSNQFESAVYFGQSSEKNEAPKEMQTQPRLARVGLLTQKAFYDRVGYERKPPAVGCSA